MDFTALSVVTLTVLAMVVFVQVNKGYKLGFLASILKLSAAVISVFAGVLVSTILSDKIVDSVMSLVVELEFYFTLVNEVPFITPIVAALVEILCSIILFTPIYFILNGIIALIIKLFYNKHKKAAGEYVSEDEDDLYKKSGKAGAVVGAVTGVIFTFIIMTPIFGTLSIVTDVVSVIDTYVEDDISNEPVVSEIMSYSDDFTLTVMKTCGTERLFDLVARTEINGATIRLISEINAIKGLDVNSLLESFSNPDALVSGDLSFSSIEKVLNEADKSVMAKMLLAGLLSELSDAWLNGEEYLGMPRPSFGNDEIVDPFMTELFRVCRTTTHKTVIDDLSTIINVCNHLTVITDILSTGNYDTIMKEFSEGGTLELIEAEFLTNPHMASLAGTIHDMAFRTILGEFNNVLGGDAYDDLINNIADSLNDVLHMSGSIQTSVLTEQMQEYLDSTGVEVPPEITTMFADSLLEKLEGESYVDASKLEELFKQYLEGGDLGDMGDLGDIFN